MHTFKAADSWALGCMIWHQIMICVPDLPVVATYQNNYLPLFNYSTLSLLLSTTQINKAGLFGDPEDTHYTAIFQALLKSHHNAPFPEAEFSHEHLTDFKVMSASTHAHLKSNELSVLLIQSLAKYNTHRQSCSLPVLQICPRIENFLVSFPNIGWAFATDDFIKWLAISY